MADATKARTSIHASATLTAGAGDTTSSAVDLTAAMGNALNIRLLNGATGPTLPAQVQIQVSADDSTYFNHGGPLVGGTANNGDYTWGGIDIPIGNMYVRLVSGSNTGQDVTITADIGIVTAVE